MTGRIEKTFAVRYFRLSQSEAKGLSRRLQRGIVEQRKTSHVLLIDGGDSMKSTLKENRAKNELRNYTV